MNIQELFNLKGQVAIVTGARAGLGYHMATGLAEAGTNLVIASRNYDLCKDACDDFKKKFKVDAIPIKVDVIKEQDIINMFNITVEHYGKVDILVNNVGGAIISDTLVTKLSDWKDIIDLTLTSSFICCREAGKYMVKERYGKIINIASVYGIRGVDPRNYKKPNEMGPGKNRESLSYSTSKGGIINLTKDLGVNWAKYNITVNAISPGLFLTEATENFLNDYIKKKLDYRIPMGKWGTDDDLKGAIVFLASNASKYVTGQNLIVDGGWSSWC